MTAGEAVSSAAAALRRLDDHLPRREAIVAMAARPPAIVAIAACLAVVLVGDVARIATHGGSTKAAAPTPVAANDGLVIPPAGAGAPSPSAIAPTGLVTPGYFPLNTEDVAADLANRLPSLNPALAIPDTGSTVSGFHTPDQVVAMVPAASRGVNAKNLATEGLQGEDIGIWVNAGAQSAYRISIERFATEAGGATHLANVRMAASTTEPGDVAVAEDLPGAYALSGPFPGDAKLVQRLLLLHVGRYYSQVTVIGQAAQGEAALVGPANELATAMMARLS